MDVPDYDKDHAEARYLPLHLHPPTINGTREEGAELHHGNSEFGCEASSSSSIDPPKIIWRRSWRGLSGSFIDVGSQSRGDHCKGSSIGGEGCGRLGQDQNSKNCSPWISCTALAWCCRPVMWRLQQRSVEQVCESTHRLLLSNLGPAHDSHTLDRKECYGLSPRMPNLLSYIEPFCCCIASFSWRGGRAWRMRCRRY